MCASCGAHFDVWEKWEENAEWRGCEDCDDVWHCPKCPLESHRFDCMNKSSQEDENSGSDDD